MVIKPANIAVFAPAGFQSAQLIPPASCPLRPGLDYTVAHYGILTKDPRLDCVLCFVDDAEDEKSAAWDEGEVGGFEAYLLADDDEANGPADTYRQVNEALGKDFALLKPTCKWSQTVVSTCFFLQRLSSICFIL